MAKKLEDHVISLVLAFCKGTSFKKNRGVRTFIKHGIKQKWSLLHHGIAAYASKPFLKSHWQVETNGSPDSMHVCFLKWLSQLILINHSFNAWICYCGDRLRNYSRTGWGSSSIAMDWTFGNYNLQSTKTQTADSFLLPQVLYLCPSMHLLYSASSRSFLFPQDHICLEWFHP